MTAKFDIKTLSDLKSELEIAALTERSLPSVKARGAKSSWPDFLQDPTPLGILLAQKPEFSPTSEDVEKWETICTEWIKFFTPSERRKEWAVVWLRACHVPQKVIASKVKMSRTSVWHCYERGIHKLFIALTGGGTHAVGASQRRRIVGFTRDLRTLREVIKDLEKRIK